MGMMLISSFLCFDVHWSCLGGWLQKHVTMWSFFMTESKNTLFEIVKMDKRERKKEELWTSGKMFLHFHCMEILPQVIMLPIFLSSIARDVCFFVLCLPVFFCFCFFVSLIVNSLSKFADWTPEVNCSEGFHSGVELPD